MDHTHRVGLDISYGSVGGLSTPRDVYVLQAVFSSIGIAIAVWFGVRTHDYWHATFSVIWMCGVGYGTMRALRTLMALGPRRDDATAQLAFQLAAERVILGTLPLLLFLLP